MGTRLTMHYAVVTFLKSVNSAAMSHYLILVGLMCRVWTMGEMLYRHGPGTEITAANFLESRSAIVS